MTNATNTPTVCVIGLGYVGLPTAAFIAAHGLSVTGVDIDAAVIAAVNAATTRSSEPGLDALVRQAVIAGRLSATPKPQPADVFIIAVPTPLTPGKHADLSAVENAVHAMAPVLARGNLVLLESTCPIGTTARISHQLSNERPDLTFPHQAPERADVQLAYSPERVLPGHALHELAVNARTIGGLDARSAVAGGRFYGLFCRGELSLTGAEIAEATKLTENAYRDVNIAFANELSMICADLGIDTDAVIAQANRHPRVNILAPGPGVGGHCIPVDPWFLIQAAPDRAHLLRSARDVNTAKTAFVCSQIRAATSQLAHPVVALFGLTYKPNSDDLRGSPAVTIARDLAADPAIKLLIVEPHITSLPPPLAALANTHLTSPDHALASASLIVPLVAHDAFKSLNLIDPFSPRAATPAGRNPV